ncbi:DEAD/DEAH box helicase [Paraburkholderia sp. J8-2]|uniref:DEAD/DEAH box helicase n=1 Tax=Paraburkholderia sp. J8-2 TaxID=2805440 RepID=UPI002AB7EF67|nr:DEAD/DEAH box helicase [Paraburkholderia sp. J8-2]
MRDSSSESTSFDLLHPMIQRWIWAAGWTELRDAQERAIPPIMAAQNDVIVAAATAAGKTEAAFLPILSRMLACEARGEGAGRIALCVSPLKALINDQWDRLSRLCESLDIPVIPWHGDVAAHRKQQFARKRAGVVLITPESLEAMLYNRGSGVSALFERLDYVGIDELHAFIGSERGKQLQSLLARLETALRRRVPRVGLSATLGDVRIAAEFLRPGEGAKATIVESRDASATLKILVKGYLDGPPRLSDEQVQAMADAGRQVTLEDITPTGMLSIARDLYRNLCGSNHLIFPNSRQKVEQYTTLLRMMCERDGRAPEFWPHHGNLSRDLREETERALKQTERPASAVATSTLELGVDLGPVVSVAQIGPAPAVANLRQRLGRTGRRKGTSSILRGYALEQVLDPRAPVSEGLREALVQFVAQIELLLQRWVEPPRAGGLHLSTLIQQILSVIGQYGGVMASQVWQLLCVKGPFRAVSQEDFGGLLRVLGKHQILAQDSGGTLVHGPKGEAITGHYSFYAAFSSPEEYRLMAHQKVLGSLPVTAPLAPGDFLLFAGRRWKIEEVDANQRIVHVLAGAGGKAPSFGGSPGLVHTRVRQEMYKVLSGAEPLAYLDDAANKLLMDARRIFRRLELGRTRYVDDAGTLRVFIWQGDEVQNTIALLLRFFDVAVVNEGICLSFEDCTPQTLLGTIRDILSRAPLPPEVLLAGAQNLAVEKWDALLPSPLLQRNYASLFLDIEGAYAFMRETLAQP